ncbi:MAG TPA: hypothetical protein VK789_21025 [Bryobacteraceae bacterium]|jgi:hypothetical protein|nr:hypothetical protein [Bryobacteraceae bacterium]
MDCLTCDQLAAECERLERNCTEARGYLSEARGTSGVKQYNIAKAQANEAWLDSEVARIELERHRRTHSLV